MIYYKWATHIGRCFSIAAARVSDGATKIVTQLMRAFGRVVRSTAANEETARRGLLINSLTLVLFFGGMIIIPSAFASRSPLFLVGVCGGLTLLAITFILSKYNYINVAAILLIGFITVIVSQSIILAPSYVLAYGNYAFPLTLVVVISASIIHPIAPFICAAIHTAVLVIALWMIPLHPQFDLDDPPAFTPLLTVLLMLWFLAFFSWQSARTVNNTLRRLFGEKTALAVANATLDERHVTSAAVGQQVRSLTYTLTGVTTQQVSGAQEQAAALIQVQQAIRELTRTAEQIAESATQVEQAAIATDSAAQRVLNATQSAAASSTQGQRAVAQTITASEEVNSVYTALTRTLIDLAERSLRIKAILELTQTIADETHLLALNAAIEAVGASHQGSRFSVVAQRVKELADRSRDASMQIGQIVRELQSRIQSAVMVAESGEKRARQSVGVAHESGAAITALAETVQQAAQEAESIFNTAQSVSDLARLIGQATREQQTASTQILSTLTSVSTVAEATVITSENLSQSVRDLDKLSSNLNRALIKV